MLVTTPVTILKTYDYGDTSRILRCLGRDVGLCSLIAKGARRPRSRFSGCVEPFTDGIATFYAKEGRELHTCSAFELVRERQALGRDLLRFAGAGLLTELVLRFAPSAPDLRLYRQLRRGLDRLLRAPGDGAAIALQEAWALVAAMGFRPAVDRCLDCGQPAEPSRAAFAFDPGAGGLRCDRCARRAQPPVAAAGRAWRLPPAAVAELRGLLRPGRRNGTPPLRTLRLQRALFGEFVAYHLGADRPLNALRFLERYGGG
jgi:DNA repair protein RecO (recombination protein O)